MSHTIYMTKYKTTLEERDKMVQLYKSGLSAYEIHEYLSPRITARQIQRIMRDLGIVRTHGDAFRLAVAKGRVPYDKRKKGKKPRKAVNNALRWSIMTRDGFQCRACGRTAKHCPLDVDHINGIPTDDRQENLQILCQDCNLGKYAAGRIRQ